MSFKLIYKKLVLFLFVFSFLELFICAESVSNVYLSFDEILQGTASEGMTYTVNHEYDLKEKIIELPLNCTIVFKEKGCIKNGKLLGKKTKIQYAAPFIGDFTTISNCQIVGKEIIRDVDVFLNISHTQKEIQQLFDLSEGTKIVFSKGIYQNVEKIVINSNVEADFNNSTIKLYHDKNHVGECFYMEPWVDKHLDYFKISNLRIEGKRHGITNSTKARRCIQLFYVSDVLLENITIDKYYSGPYESKSDKSDLLNKSRIGACAIAIMRYDRCVINGCSANEVTKTAFACAPNTNVDNITYFTNNKSTYSSKSGSDTFLSLYDGRCVVKNNEVHNYNGSAFNLFCYESEIAYNRFYDGKRSVAIDLSEGVMYRANNVKVHHNICENCKGLLQAYGENIRVENNSWTNNLIQTGAQFYVISILTRGARESDGKYIGSDNNSKQDEETNIIKIANNHFVNYSHDKSAVIRGACIYGNNITYTSNEMSGFDVPVVQFVNGDNFEYSKNVINKSYSGDFAELLIKRSNGLKILDNNFCNNMIDIEKSYTVQVVVGEGSLMYRGNMTRSIDQNKKYIPCYVKDYSNLNNVEIYVKDCNESLNAEVGIVSDKIKLKTNIR